MKNQTFQFNSSESQQHQRIDAFLVEQLALNKSQIQKGIKRGEFVRNGKKINKGGVMLNDGDTIGYTPVSQEELKKSAKEFAESRMFGEPEIILDAKNYAVVYKPAGMLTHPTDRGETNTLADWIVEQFPETKTVGEHASRPGIVHRLDKMASGILVVAKSQEMYEHLKANFQDRAIQKEYSVLVYGEVEQNQGVIDFPIDRASDGKMLSRPVQGEVRLDTIKDLQEGKDSLTSFQVNQRYFHHTLLAVKIYSGRTHQIRVHFLAYNHPVVGDDLYYQKQYKKFAGNLERLFLHSRKLAFTDLSGKQVVCEKDIPEELKAYLQSLKKQDAMPSVKTQPSIVIISGPSGAGEDSVINGLEECLDIERVVTTTTREPREGESEGNPYYFISQKEFEEKIERGEFFEYAQHYNDNYYGVTFEEINRVKAATGVGIWKIDYKGVQKAKELMPDILAIYIGAPLDILEKRIRKRSDVSEAYVKERMAYSKEWLNHLDIYDMQVENEEGKLDQTINKVARIIRGKE